MQLNLSGNLGGQIDEMLEGSVAGNLKFLSASTLETLNVTENGTYTPPTGVDGYDEVNVDVPIPEPVLDTLNITQNGTYTPPTGVDGYNEVNVDVPIPEPVLDTLNVTQNGTYTPPTGVDGYDEVNVNVDGYRIITNPAWYCNISGNWFNTNVQINSNYDYSYDFRMVGSWTNDGSILGNSYGGSSMQWTPYNSYWYYSDGNQEYRDGSIGSEYVGDHNITYNDRVVFDGNTISNFTRKDLNYYVYIGHRAGANVNSNTWFKKFTVTDKTSGDKISEFIPARIVDNNDNIFAEGIIDTISNKFIIMLPITTV